MTTKNYIITLLLIALTGCAVTKDWVVTGGSRADAIMKLSYEHSIYEAPQTDPQQALNLARSRCTAWGYSNAEAFGGETRVCNNPSSSGCNSWIVTREYQCLGGGTLVK
jgi:hypothetical protein